MKLLSVAQAADNLGMSRQNFSHEILPLMADLHQAQRVGRAWVVDESVMWEWKLYSATRRNLIDAGVWLRDRPWSVADLDDIVRVGMWADYQPE